MAKQITRTVYTFEELTTDRAKERARDWYRQGMETRDYAECTIEDATTIADLIGIDLRKRPVKLMGGGTRYEPAIYWSGFSSQGDGASFEASYSYKRGALRAVMKYAPQDTELHRIAGALQDAQKRYGYKLNVNVTQSGRYSHSNTMSFDIEHDAVDCNREIDAATIDAIEQAMRDFADWIYRQLEKEYEFQNSDEQVDEAILANEYTFDEEGNREG